MATDPDPVAPPEEPAPADAPGGGPPGRGLLGALVALAVVLALLRGLTYAEPLEHNLTTYAVIGHELNAGAALYADVWDHKPPAIYLTYALAERAAGYGPAAVLLLNLLAGWATLGGVFVLASRGPGGWQTGLWAAAAWAIGSGAPELRANQPDSEVFLNACLTWALAALALAPPERRVSRPLLAAGALFALATAYKLNAVFVPAAVAGVLLVAAGAERRRTVAAQAAVLVGVGVAAWLAIGAAFALGGRFGDLWATVILFNRTYAGSLLANAAVGLRPDVLLPAPLWRCALPLLVLPAVGAAVAWRRGLRPGRPVLLVIGALVGVWLTVAAPGKFYVSYYQLWLPPLVVASAWALPLARRRALVAASALVVLVGLAAPAWTRPAREWPVLKYGRTFGAVFAANPAVGQAADALLEPGETLYVWDEGAGVYYYARRRPPVAVLWVGKLLGQRPDQRARAEQTVAQLERRRPELVVQNRALPFPPDNPVAAWLEANTAPPPRPLSPSPLFRFRLLRGGRLERSLHAGGR